MPHFAKFLSALLTDFDWLQRRIETVEFLDRHTQERRVSLDIDIERLRRLAEFSSLDWTSWQAGIPIPFAFQKKKLLYNLDLQYNGETVPVLTSQRDSLCGTLALIDALSTSPGYLDLRPIIKGDIDDYSVDDRMEVLERSLFSHIKAHRDQPESSEISAIRKQTRTGQSNFIRWFQGNYFEMLRVNFNDPRCLVKYTLITDPDSTPVHDPDSEDVDYDSRSKKNIHRSTKESLGLARDRPIAVMLSGFERASSSYFRVEAPSGAIITRAVIATQEEPTHNEESYFLRRSRPSQAVLQYHNKAPLKSFIGFVWLSEDPAASGMPSFHLFNSLIILMSLFHIAAALITPRILRQGNGTPFLSLLLSLSTLVASYALHAVRNPHPAVKYMGRWVRNLSIASLFTLIVTLLLRALRESFAYTKPHRQIASTMQTIADSIGIPITSINIFVTLNILAIILAFGAGISARARNHWARKSPEATDTSMSRLRLRHYTAYLDKRS